jgi:probable rRNA maturation factor
MITINLNSHPDIKEDIFVQNAIDIVQKIVDSEILEQSPLSDYDFKSNEISIDIMFCDNEAIHQINKDYRGKDQPTDVITFALFADSDEDMRILSGDEISLGEIIISLERIQEQAKSNAKTFEEELYFILAHGILHLFGYTHNDEVSLEKMLELQQRLVKDVKI